MNSSFEILFMKIGMAWSKILNFHFCNLANFYMKILNFENNTMIQSPNLPFLELGTILWS